MKWREPWTISLKQQRRFNLLSREALTGMAVWTIVLTATGVVASLAEDLSVQLERLSNLWIAPAIGVPLAIVLYVIRWLSPRIIDSGPKGIVVVKGDQIVLIPWRVIEMYGFSSSGGGHNALDIKDQWGVSHSLYLADTVDPGEVERELRRAGSSPPERSRDLQEVMIFGMRVRLAA